MLYTSSSGLIELTITRHQAAIGSHQGQCDMDIAELRGVPAIRRQLNKIKPEVLRKELEEYGAWDDAELSNHNQNLSRLLWITCGDIIEGIHQRGKA